MEIKLGKGRRAGRYWVATRGRIDARLGVTGQFVHIRSQPLELFNTPKVTRVTLHLAQQ
jgi:hypothetical protein